MDSARNLIALNAEEWTPTACTLDHDGCVVCSDAGIPLRVLALEGDDALCADHAGGSTLIAIELVVPVTVGEVLITHGGVAIGRLSTPQQGGAQRKALR